jgi:hypothetical protein
MISTEGSRTTQNPKNRHIREQVDQTIWIPYHSGITGIETADETTDEAAKKKLEQEISENELYARVGFLKIC